MPSKLTQRPEELIRSYLVSAVRPGEIEGYDPTQTDPQANDYLPFTTDYSRWGETYPLVWFGEEDSPTVPNSGETGFNGLQGDGSGPNIYEIHNITVSVQTLESDSGAGYLNQTEYDTLAFEIYNEIKHQIQNNTTGVNSDFQFVGISPSTPLRDAGEESDTTTFYQESGTIFVGVIDEP
jgi:hypothetical protein